MEGTLTLLTADTLVQDRYRIVQQIGHGNMGAVYEAVDEHLLHTVALKQTLVRATPFSKAFEREAKILAGLRHPVLPRVIDHFVNECGQFMVMDFFPGKDLGELMRLRGEPFLVNAVLRWADQVLHALEYLHRQSPPVVHRDIKPRNLKLTAEGQVVLLDFGLATVKETTEMSDRPPPMVEYMPSVPESESDSHAREGSSDQVFGFTRQYAPPEQIHGAGADHRSDLYALGATLYHLLTGSPPPDALSRLYALGFDNYAPYEAGVETLLKHLRPNDACYKDALACGAALRENIALARKEGDTTERHEERLDLIGQLGDMTRSTLDISFHRLCRLKIPEGGGEAGDDGVIMRDPLRPVHERNPQVPEAVGRVVHQALSLQADYRPASAEAMRLQLQAIRRAMEGEDGDANLEAIEDQLFLPPHPEPEEEVQRRRKKPATWPVVVIVVVLITQITLMVMNRIEVDESMAEATARALDGPSTTDGGGALPVAAVTPVPGPLEVLTTANVSRATELARWSGRFPDRGVQSVAFAPAGQFLASSGGDGSVLVWRLNESTVLHTLTGHTAEVQSVAFSPDGRVLASGAKDRTVRLWRVSDGTVLHTLEGHTETVQSVAFVLEGTVLASGSVDGTVRLWRVEDGSLLDTLTIGPPVRSVAAAPGGMVLAVAAGNEVVLRQMRDGQEIRRLSGHRAEVQSVAFGAEGTLLASGAEDNTVRVWQVRDGSLAQTMTGHSDGVRSVVFVPGGALLVSGADDDTVRVWRVRDGGELRVLEGHADVVQSMAVGPSGRLLVSGGNDGTVRLWGVLAGGDE